MDVPYSSSIPKQQTSEHSGATLMKRYYTNGATAPHSISPNITARLSNFPPSDPLLPNQTLPAPGNTGWILLKMARTHRETYFKVSPRIRDHRKGNMDHQKQQPAAAASTNVTPLSTKAG